MPRPVLVVEVAGRHDDASLQYAGEVRARYESKIGFRVGGKIIRRAVNVGDKVTAGRLVAELDPADYQLARDALHAQLRAARSEYEFAVSDLQRYRELLQERLLSPAEFERRETSVGTLRDRVAGLSAQFEQAQLQTQYTRLIADHDSVVMSLPGEAGQVVAAGQPIVVLARLSELEVAIDVPEAHRQQVKAGSPVSVKFWTAPEAVLEGRVREVAASADPGARTYAVRVALPRRPEWMQIGMSATAAFASADQHASQHVIPLSAIFVPQGDAAAVPRVWTLGGDNTVHALPVTVGAPIGASEVRVSGLRNGLRIVTAGASRLREGEAVSVLAPFAIGGSLVSAPTPLHIAK